MRVTLLTALALAGLVSSAQAQQSVSWTNNQNVMVRGGSLIKAGGCNGCDDAGARSQQVIRGDGAVDFTVGEDWSFWMAGLTRQDGNTRFGNIDYAIRINGNGWADVMERGQYVGGDTDYRAGDTFKIQVSGNQVRYMKNNQVMYVSRQRPTFPMAFDVVLGSSNATVRNARIDAQSAPVGTSGSALENEFYRLDRNNDGIVQRGEWTGNRGQFNRRDRNRDGVLSPAEFGMAEYDSATNRASDRWNGVGTSGRYINVNADQEWTDTGIWVQAGDNLTIDADGSIRMSANPSDSAGPAGSSRRANNAPVLQASAGTLIGRIGNGAPFVVGASRRMRAATSGQLFLGVNDDHFEDNNGAYRATVSVTR